MLVVFVLFAELLDGLERFLKSDLHLAVVSSLAFVHIADCLLQLLLDLVVFDL